MCCVHFLLREEWKSDKENPKEMLLPPLRIDLAHRQRNFKENFFILRQVKSIMNMRKRLCEFNFKCFKALNIVKRRRILTLNLKVEKSFFKATKSFALLILKILWKKCLCFSQQIMLGYCIPISSSFRKKLFFQ